MLKTRSVKIERLRPWQDNPRSNDQAVEAVAASIERFGFNVPILCDEDFLIVAGHTRWKAAKKLGMTSVPVIPIKISETERRAFAIADNKTAELAEWDFLKLRDVLRQLRSEEVELDALGFSTDELRRLLGGIGSDEDDVPRPKAATKTRLGDLWLLGRHRLLCGDSRTKSHMRRLRDGERMDHVFGGPPYFNQRDYSQWDNYRDYLADMGRIIQNCVESLKDGGVVVWNIAHDCSSRQDLASHHSRLMEEAGMVYLDTISWVKSGGNFAVPRNLHIRRSRRYYPAFQWEPLLVYQKPGEMPLMTADAVSYMLNHQTNVWEVPAITHQVERYGHPAVCPVEIPYRAILAYTPNGGSVLEPFGGSGTTLIAAEKAGRAAFVMEKLPEYCDVIVQRWKDFTGERPKRVTPTGRRRRSKG